jgi:hypothetical protein
MAVRVNAAPNVPAFVPAVAMRADDTYGVSYYDFRNNTADPLTLLTDYWLRDRAMESRCWRATSPDPSIWPSRPTQEVCFSAITRR